MEVDRQRNGLMRASVCPGLRCAPSGLRSIAATTREYEGRENTMDMSVTVTPKGDSVRPGRGQKARPRRQCERSRSVAREGRGHGRAQAHHRGGRSRSRSRDHHVSGGSREIAGAGVREHQGPSRPQGALQHDRLQPLALLPDDRRAAGRSSAQGGAGAAEEARPQDAAEGGPGRAGDLQPEHRRGRRDRHPHVPGAAHVAARRRQISRHRRRGGDRSVRRPGASTSAPTA